jgi:hypothetical protein
MLFQGSRRIRHVLRDRVLDPQFATLFEQQDAGCCELLGDRAEAEFGVRGIGDIPFEICRAVALVEDDLSVAVDQNRAHEVLLLHGVLNDLLDSLRVRLVCLGCRGLELFGRKK